MVLDIEETARGIPLRDRVHECNDELEDGIKTCLSRQRYTLSSDEAGSETYQDHVSERDEDNEGQEEFPLARNDHVLPGVPSIDESCAWHLHSRQYQRPNGGAKRK